VPLIVCCEGASHRDTEGTARTEEGTLWLERSRTTNVLRFSFSDGRGVSGNDVTITSDSVVLLFRK
jgi:hypothetical protein